MAAVSIAVVTAWGYLIHSGSISTIWPMFGVSNQLLAAIAFGVGTTVIIKSGKVKYAWTTFIPMVFMFVTTLTASWELIRMFLDQAGQVVSSTEALTFKIDAFLVSLFATLALIVLADMSYTWYTYFAAKRKLPAAEVAQIQET